MRIYLILFLLFIKYNVLDAQMLHLSIINNVSHQTEMKKDYIKKSDLEKDVNKFLLSYNHEGYLLASYDSIVTSGDKYKYYLNPNQRFKWVQLDRGNLENILASELFYAKKFDNQYLKYQKVAQLIESILLYYENNGYPFASVKLDSVKIDSSTLSASLIVNKNRQIKIDSIIIQGNLKVSKRFLYRYIDVKPGELYNETALKSIEKKLLKLPFVYNKQAPLIRITDKYNKVYLFLDNKNVSQFDGIIGLLPNSNGQSIITGNIKIKLVNSIFKNADQIDINWQRVQPLTQDAKLSFSIPYIVGTPIGANYNFSLFKKDTTFIDVQNQLGFSYYFSGLNCLQFFYKQKNSNLISTYGLSGITTLPNYADITTKAYGLGININQLNNINNPSKGWQIQANISVGNKNIQKNPKINDIAYKNILLNSLQYQSDGNFDVFIPNFLRIKYNTIKFGLKYAFINGNTSLFKNELYRIGGLKTIRGFNEQSIYASAYAIPSLEYRFLYNENGYVMLFSDFAFYNNYSANTHIDDKLYSFGGGIQLETKAGLISIIYAVGSSFGQSPDFRTGKIHTGFVKVF